MHCPVRGREHICNYRYGSNVMSGNQNMLLGYGTSPVVERAVFFSNSDASPWLFAYKFNTSSGFGTRYANPATLPSGGTSTQGIAVSAAGTEVIQTTSTSPGQNAYRFTIAAGWGTKYAAPSTALSNATGISLSPSETAIGIAMGGGGSLACAYRWSTSGWGTRYTNPASVPGQIYDVCFNPDETAILMGCDSGPVIVAYRWSSAGFGTKYSNPASLPTTDSSFTAGNTVQFHPNNNACMIGFGVTPFLTSYQWSSAGFGTKYALPASPPTASVYSSYYSTDGNFLFTSPDSSASGNMAVSYAWSTSGYGTKYTNTALLTGAYPYDMVVTKDDKALVMGGAGTPFIFALRWSSSGFGGRYASPSSSPTTRSFGIAVT